MNGRLANILNGRLSTTFELNYVWVARVGLKYKQTPRLLSHAPSSPDHPFIRPVPYPVIRFLMSNLLQIIAISFVVASSSVIADEAPTEFNYPLAVIATESGTVYVADRNLPGVWKVEDGKKSIYFQGSKKFRTPLNAIRCLAIDHEGTEVLIPLTDEIVNKVNIMEQVIHVSLPEGLIELYKSDHED